MTGQDFLDAVPAPVFTRATFLREDDDITLWAKKSAGAMNRPSDTTG